MVLVAIAWHSPNFGARPHVGPALQRRPPRRLHHIQATSVVQPEQLRLGADIPIALRQWTVGDRRFLLAAPADIDAVMEMYLAAGQPDRDPYWCEPWPSALAMAEELLQRPDLVAGRRVCELGCGLGLAGLAAAMAGAAEVVLLDREPLALQCALLNASLNGLPAAEAAGGAAKVQPLSLEQLLPHLQPTDVRQLEEQRAHLEQLRQQSAAAGLPPSGDAHSSSSNSSNSSSGSGSGSGQGAGLVRAEVFDWSQPVTISRHDVMLVCDCLYEAFSVQPVAEVAPKLLKRHDSRLLLADPPERARHNRECFLDILCEESGEFVVEESGEKSVRLWEASKGGYRQHRVAMMHLRRASGGDTVGVKLGRGGQL